MNRLIYLACAPLFLTATLSAHALPGEAAAVIAHCGQPTSETRGTSDVTNLPQRSLTYNDMRLNFEPMGSGWSFTSGWHNHLPESANEVAARMPCFGAALAEVAAAPANSSVDPTIAAQTAPPSSANRATFGVANLWLILFLVGIIAIFGIAVPRGRKMVRRPKVIERSYRRPQLSMIPARFRRRPPTDIDKR